MNGEVKPGYKLTEVGVIPDDWECTTVQGIASSVRNAIVGGPFGSDLVSNDYVSYGVPVIRGQNMGTRWVSGDFVFVSNAKADSLESNLAHPFDLIFTQRGTLGQVSQVPEKLFDRYLVSQSQMKLTLNRKIADPNFFYYVFSSKGQQELIRKNTIQTGIPHINLGILRTLPVQRPTYLEQRAIAEVLSDADALIESLEQLITKKRQIKQGAMQDLLTGKKRLPGFSGEWEVKSLGEISITNKGSQLHDSESTQDGTHPHLNGGIAPSGYAEKSNTPANTIAVSEGGNSCGYVQLMKVPYWCGGHCYSIISKCVDNDFLYHALKAQQTALMGLRVGSGLPNVQKTALLSFKLCYPSGGSEQTAIAEILMDMDSEIEALEVKLEKAHQLKQCMMRKLLTGQIRLVRLTKDSCKVSELCSKFK